MKKNKIIMKRVRITLGAIAALRAVVGALAFKTKRPSAPFRIGATTFALASVPER